MRSESQLSSFNNSNGPFFVAIPARSKEHAEALAVELAKLGRASLIMTFEREEQIMRKNNGGGWLFWGYSFFVFAFGFLSGLVTALLGK